MPENENDILIGQQLQSLKVIKSEIKQAIVDKGVSVPANTAFTDYPSKIAQIEGGGSVPVLESLTITPSTTSQTLTPPSGVDGYDDISVNAVTASIDPDITAGNIKSGVEILGVTGNYEGEPAVLQSKTFTASSTMATVSTVTPDSGYEGLDEVGVDLTYVEDELDDVLTGSVVLSSVEATEYLEGVRSALIRMGVNVDSNTPYSQLATKIGEISMGSTKVTFADGYYFLDEATNYCKLIIDTEYGEMTKFSTSSVPAASGYLEHNAFTAYRYKREFSLPVTFATTPNVLPFAGSASALVDITSGVEYSTPRVCDGGYCCCYNFPEDTWNYSNDTTWPVYSGTVDYDNATNKVILYQRSINTDTYIPTARAKVVFEGEITPPSQE